MSTKLVFASCCKFKHAPVQAVWSEIRAEQPDLVVLLGDTVYLKKNSGYNNASQLQKDLRARYDEQLAESHFAALRADLAARGAKMLATYDDHDFIGDNRYGADAKGLALRETARAELIRAFAPPQTGNDVYADMTVGPAHVLMLDCRYYRRSPKGSADDVDAILGKAQWLWLEHTFRASKSPFLIVATSSTIHRLGNEHWSQYPAALARLRALFGDRKGAFAISGDVHQNHLRHQWLNEIVSSAVARDGLLGIGKLRANYAVLTFSNAEMRIELRSLDAKQRTEVTVPLSAWRFPNFNS